MRMAQQHFAQFFQLSRIISCAGRVGRRVQDQPTRLWRNGSFQLFGRDFIILRCSRHNDHGRSAGELHDIGIADPIRCRDDNFVALINRCDQGVKQGVLTTGVYRDLLWRIFNAIVALEFCDDCLLERGDTVHGGIFRHAVTNGLNGGLFDEFWRVEIGFTRRQSNDIDAL